MKIKLLDKGCKPFKKFPTDAGWDLICRESVRICPGETVLIPTGVGMAIPTGHVGDISPRSSGSKKGLVIQGKVDAEYRGEVQIIATNCGKRAITVDKGERIAQLVIMRIHNDWLEEVDELDMTPRGENGFGHTGRFAS